MSENQGVACVSSKRKRNKSQNRNRTHGGDAKDVQRYALHTQCKAIWGEEGKETDKYAQGKREWENETESLCFFFFFADS